MPEMLSLLGYTRNGKTKLPAAEVMETYLRDHIDAYVAGWDEIDDTGQFSADNDLTPEDQVLTLLGGFEVYADDGGNYGSTFGVPDDRGLYLTVIGGSTGGDYPFEEFGHLELFLGAASHDRELAALVGFLGWGIRLGQVG